MRKCPASGGIPLFTSTSRRNCRNRLCPAKRAPRRYERRAHRIGAFVEESIPDGATLQFGIGAILLMPSCAIWKPNATSAFTANCFPTASSSLDRGVITNDSKTLHPGKIVAGFLLARRLYKFVHDNAMIELHPDRLCE